MAGSMADNQDPAKGLPAQGHAKIEPIRPLVSQQLTSKAYVLGRLGREVRRYFTQTLALWNLNPSHYGVLLLLREGGQASQQQLANQLNIDRANMVDVLDVLEKRGLVERTADQLDRRRHVISLTSSGSETMRQMQQAEDTLDHEFFLGLDALEQATLHTLLTKLFKSHLEE